MNNLKTVALLGFLSALVWYLGMTLFRGSGGFYVGLIFAVGINVVTYFFSDKLALKMSRAKPVTEQELPQIYSIVRNLTTQADMPMPRIYMIDSPQPNAFATGRNPSHAAVAVTSGIMQILNRDELEGVIGHELSHVRNRDILISSIAAMLAAALSISARMAFWFGGGRRSSRDNPLGGIVALVSLILAPIAAMIIRLAISRAREYQADASGATLTGQPLNLASALRKLEMGTSRVPMNVNPAVSQLFIADPLKALKGRNRGLFGKLFSTHPPIEDRVRRLEEMAYGDR
ncbi:MAG TPA: protease HtpX [Actinobacteria bacterium]|nr:protease HtpX [Actinomycetota bacterium]HDK45163.1 protease HtpX [Actinomycetota bacterium]HDL50200.1 protease HtpX [Actinomycetota bacterium]